MCLLVDCLWLVRWSLFGLFDFDVFVVHWLFVCLFILFVCVLVVVVRLLIVCCLVVHCVLSDCVFVV